MEPVSAFPAELIEVRKDERFDERRLAEWLRGRLEGSEQLLLVRQFGGGHANLTYCCATARARRRRVRAAPAAAGPYAARSHDMQREYARSRSSAFLRLRPRAYAA